MEGTELAGPTAKRAAGRGKTRSFLPVMRKEWIHIKRDPRLLTVVFVAPVLMLTLFGYALRLQPQNIPMSVFDEDRTYASMMVKDKIESEGYFVLSETDSLGRVEDLILKGDAKAGLHIPGDFSAKIFDGRTGDLTLYVDGTMPTMAIAAQLAAVPLTSDEFARGLVLQDPDAPPVKYAPRPVKLEKEILYNPDLKDQNFFIPGLIGILIMWITLVLTSMGLVREREYRTFEQLIVTPVGRVSLILGKIAPYAVIASLDFLIITLAGHLIFGVPVVGSKALLVLLAVLYIVGFLSLGMFLSTLAQTQTQSIFFGVFVIIPSILLAGFVFPVEAMPRVLQPIPKFIPLYYFLRIARGVMLKGTGLAIVYKDFIALFVFSLIFIAASALRFKKTIE
jgi:ABC-2 type transport system permease protein